MKRLAPLIAVILTASAADQPAAELSGRTPGKPQRCVTLAPGAAFSTSDSDPHLLLYDDGKTIWASRLDSSCGFGPSESIIPDETAAYYCRGDFVRQGNRIELSPFGRRCALGNFVPYRAPKAK
jgi:hypothetical protein